MSEAWADYCAKVVPTYASRVQITECRRAFYAGAEALLVMLMGGLDPGPEATAADENLLRKLHDELHQFAADVLKGKA